MTFFSTFFKITFVLNFSFCQQSQLFITLLKRVQKGTPGGHSLHKKITTQKISRQMSRFAVIFGFCTILAGTQEIITSRDEHCGPNLIIMSLIHSPPLPAPRFSIKPLNFGSKWAKNAKTQKIRYKSVITQKSVVKNSKKILKFPPHVLRSVCHLQVYECMRHSCFTCFTIR